MTVRREGAPQAGLADANSIGSISDFDVNGFVR
jgi:hypothetical protein